MKLSSFGLFFSNLSRKEIVILCVVFVLATGLVIQIGLFCLVTTLNVNAIANLQLQVSKQHGWTRVVWLSNHLCGENSTQIVNIHCESVRKVSKPAYRDEKEQLINTVLADTRNSSLLYRLSLLQLDSTSTMDSVYEHISYASTSIAMLALFALISALIVVPVVRYYTATLARAKLSSKKVAEFNDSFSTFFESSSSSSSTNTFTTNVTKLQIDFQAKPDTLRQRLKQTVEQP
jgi:hypothetical protein